MRVNDLSTFRDFHRADQYLGDRRDEATVANNTTLVRRDADTIALRLYATDVVTFHRNGSITLNTGGHRTATTKQRMNAVLNLRGFGVFAKNGDWYLVTRRHGDGIAKAFVNRGLCGKLYDGLNFNPNV